MPLILSGTLVHSAAWHLEALCLFLVVVNSVLSGGQNQSLVCFVHKQASPYRYDAKMSAPKPTFGSLFCVLDAPDWLKNETGRNNVQITRGCKEKTFFCFWLSKIISINFCKNP